MFKSIAKKILQPLPDRLFTHVLYFLRHQKLLNLRKPKTFNEKITFIKLHSKNPLRHLVVDRLKVRDYVVQRSSDVKLVPILWTGTDFNLNVYDSLPREFVIKGNHGSQMVVIVDKEHFDYTSLSQKIGDWMNVDYSKAGRERVYQTLDRYFVVEEKLSSPNITPPDFKFFCFQGKVEMVQVDFNRFSKHTRNLYDRNFKELDVKLHRLKGDSMERPSSYVKAVKIAETLSSEFSFIRVDLYLIGDDVFFGELTNFPGNGLEKFTPSYYDKYLGDKLEKLI